MHGDNPAVVASTAAKCRRPHLSCFEQPPSLPNRFAVDHDRPIKRNAGLVNRARPSQYDAEHEPTPVGRGASTPVGRGASRHRRPSRSRRRNPPRSSPGRTGKRHVTAARPPPAGRGASPHRRPPHSSMRSAIPLMSDTLRRRHLTRRRSASRPEAAGSSAARSSRQGDQKRRSAWCNISRGREKTLFRPYL